MKEGPQISNVFGRNLP